MKYLNLFPLYFSSFFQAQWSWSAWAETQPNRPHFSSRFTFPPSLWEDWQQCPCWLGFTSANFQTKRCLWCKLQCSPYPPVSTKTMKWIIVVFFCFFFFKRGDERGDINYSTSDFRRGGLTPASSKPDIGWARSHLIELLYVKLKDEGNIHMRTEMMRNLSSCNLPKATQWEESVPLEW